MPFKRYTKRPTILTYLLCFLQCVSLLLAPTSIQFTISLWILSLSLSLLHPRCVYLQFPFHDLLQNKISGYTLNQSKNDSIVRITHLPTPFASVAVNKDCYIVSNPSSESPSITNTRRNMILCNRTQMFWEGMQRSSGERERENTSYIE